MSSITETARAFFTACEEGKGWDACSAYCTPQATFSAQSEALADVKTVAQYTEWMKGILTVLTDGRYELKSFATDSDRNNVCAYATFIGTHLAGGPVDPTGENHENGLRLRDAIRGRQDRPSDKDLELWLRPEGAWLGLIIEPSEGETLL